MTAATTPGDRRVEPPPADKLRGDFAWWATARTITPLQTGYCLDRPPAVAAVARLRRQAGTDPYASAGSWGLDDLEEIYRLRDHIAAAEAAVTDLHPAEEMRQTRAVHLAVTLWALHQQSIRDDDMHRRDWPLGRAVRRLALGAKGTQDDPAPPVAGAGAAPEGEGGGDGVSETVRRRLVRLGSSGDFEILSVRLREMVTLLRGARIPLDYAQLARQLEHWQQPHRQTDVRRIWGRDFHRVRWTDATDDADRPGAHA